MDNGRMKARYDRATNTEGVREGQLVLFYNPTTTTRKKGLSPTLWSGCDGPYKIIKWLNDVVYRIQKAGSRWTKMMVAHKERLAKYGKRDNKPTRNEQA